MCALQSRFLCVLVLSLVSIANGQQQQPAKSEKPDLSVISSTEFAQRDFDSLLRERDGLTTEIETLTTDIYWLNDAISKLEEMKRAKKANKPVEEIEKAISQSLENAHLAGTAPEDFGKQLDLKTQSSTDKQKRKSAIDAELVRRADIVGPQQKFKLEMSYIFAILVGCVIVGFFAVAFRDEQVRREIFSGQAGIQFVTLFSLVIAIILFGIIDILEGKELAALLGGLSGYILGRSTSTASERQAPPAGGGPDDGPGARPD